MMSIILSLQAVNLLLIAAPKGQPAWVPKFTTVGFEKRRIPQDAFAMLLWDYQRKKSIVYEEFISNGAMINEKIIQNAKKAQSSIKNVKTSFIIELWLSFLLKLIYSYSLSFQ